MEQEDKIRLIKMLVEDYLGDAMGNDYDKLHDMLDIALGWRERE